MLSTYAGYITLIGAIILVGLFIIVIRRLPAQPATQVVPKLYQIRKYYFFVIMTLFTVLLVWVLQNTPYPQLQNKKADMIVSVIGRTWMWQTFVGEYDSDMMDTTQTEQLTIPAGKVVEFQVAAKDVNHGLGVYNKKGQLMGQVQAMPGYLNKLLLTFDQPGTYYILCMEYCGAEHHVMQTTFEVSK